MIRYLFDTDICSYIVKRRFPKLQARYIQMPSSDFAISAIVFGEILTGLEKGGPHHPAKAPAEAFLASIQILDWPAAAALPYARIRQLTRKQPLQERDMLIAAHAIALDVPLVTNNIKHFGRISPPLKLDNWLW